MRPRWQYRQRATPHPINWAAARAHQNSDYAAPAPPLKPLSGTRRPPQLQHQHALHP
jgi:hypothetical protein